MENKTYLIILFTFIALVSAGCFGPESSVSFEKVQDGEQLANETAFKYSNSPQSVKNAIDGKEVILVPEPEVQKEGSIVEKNGKFYYLNAKESSKTIRIDSVKVRIQQSSSIRHDYSYTEFSDSDKKVIDSLLSKTLKEPSSETHRYIGDDIDKSVILEERELKFNYDGQIYSLSTSDYKTKSFDAYVYQSHQIANGHSQYYDYMTENYSVKLDELSEEAKKVVNKAIEETSYIGEENEGVQEINRKLNSSNAYFGESDEWIVEYNDSFYIVDLSL